MHKIVEKKILPEYFNEVIHDRKKFEIRKDKDNLQIGAEPPAGVTIYRVPFDRMKQIDGQIGLFDVKPVNEKNECLGEPCAHCDVEW